MAFLLDLVKIKYAREGYLPDYPPEFHSLSELCTAFITYSLDPNMDTTTKWEQFQADDRVCWFKDMYPLVDASLSAQYRTLVEAIAVHLYRLVSSGGQITLPDWVYSYMLGAVVGPQSATADIHDLLVMLNCDNMSDTFTVTACNACYAVSTQWLSRLSEADAQLRPPTIFGEPHVIKSLRLQQTGM